MAGFSFLHPQYLWLLFVIPLIFLIHFFSLSNRKKVALKFANFDSISRIEGIDFFSKNVFVLFLNVLIATSIVFSLSGLTFHTIAKSSDFSYVIALDSSQSMEATDFSPNRITVAKQTIVSFLNNAPLGVRFGLISFSGSTKIEKDMTERKDEVKSSLFDIGISGFGGTDIYEAVLTAANLLKNENQKAVIILSDGQINVGNIDDAIDYANDHDLIVHTIGIGTKEGGETPYGLSKLDDDSLKSLAFNTNGNYTSAGDSNELSKAFNNIYQFKNKKVSINLNDYLLLFAFALIVIEFFLTSTRYINLI